MYIDCYLFTRHTTPLYSLYSVSFMQMFPLELRKMIIKDIGIIGVVFLGISACLNRSLKVIIP